MYSFKYEIQLTSNKKIHLFGEDYFNDKKVFYETHIAMLKELNSKIEKTGFPIIITDKVANEKKVVKSKLEFVKWFQLNQPIILPFKGS